MQNEQTWILDRASLTPSKIALIDIQTKRKWSYEELSNESLKWLCYLRNEGIKKGNRVALLAENSIDIFPILFACGLGGFIYVPLNWRLSKRELISILNDSSPSILITDEEFHNLGEEIFKEKLVRIPSDFSVDSPEFNPTPQWQSTDPWLMIYTGGTMGNPKGVLLSFDAVNWNALNTILSWNLSCEDCTVNYMPLFHTGGLNALSIPILMCGGTVVVGNKFDAEEAIRSVNDYQSTISLFVPTMYQSMIETDYFQHASFPTVKVFLSGGAPCPQTIYSHFIKKGLKFKEGYGLTEAGPNNFYIDSDDAAKKPGSVGKSMMFNSIRIKNKNGAICKVGEVGELYIKGRHMFTEYWNNAEETKNAIIDGWLKTGDLAKVDGDGDVFIVGRSKDMIITGGENVYPLEVEQCIVNHPHVREVAVVGIRDEKWGEVVTAFIVSSSNWVCSESEIQNYCREQLGTYKVPKKVLFLDELPKTHVGKIDKKRLKESVN
ncbi:class I adenylate-forming enzyme family protein [Ureibacillus aquaedulcis]|uniref:AMP-binding protein n=1 Tax=Ureibacillus aquaedulcis TaxID=3058421 RepID=A0ABT8GQX0_9BACL|nr:AMP-binding protein [Ureibacillus sp. BA0131]MDN4493813.1 AMP-binding protein [Ureibacillus sp. BA0131]